MTVHIYSCVLVGVSYKYTTVGYCMIDCY